MRIGMPIFLRSWVQHYQVYFYIQKRAYNRGVVADKFLMNITNQNNKAIYTRSIWSKTQLCVWKNIMRFDIPLYTSVNHFFHNF